MDIVKSSRTQLAFLDDHSANLDGSAGIGLEPSADAKHRVDQLVTRLEMREGQWHANYEEIWLHTLNQPIVSHSHQGYIGVEALLRGQDLTGTQIMPGELFQQDITGSKDLILLERLSRLLHIANFNQLKDFTGWLFINLSPQLISIEQDADDLAAALLWAGVSPRRVVVEVTEQATYEPRGLVEAVERYRALGCLIAIDDFGAGHSNFERIWSLRPDLVKLDRNMILRAVSDPCIEQMLPRLVELIHQSGSLVLAEGIETVEQALMILNSGADLGQGYLFGHPRKELPCQQQLAQQLQSLATQSQRQWKRDWERRRRLNDLYCHHVKQAVNGIRSGKDLATAAKSLMRQNRSRRCFLLDDKGRQLDSLVSDQLSTESTPLSEDHACYWGRRSYFRNAIECPDKLHVSMPYLSVTDGSVCQTLSIFFRSAQVSLVLCCDVEPDKL